MHHHHLTDLPTKVAKSIGLPLLGSVFSVILTFSGSALLSAGHGSAFFMELIVAPVLPESNFPLNSMGSLIWPLVGALIPWRTLKGVRILISVLLFLNYTGILITLNMEAIEMAFKTLERAFPIAMPHLAVYFAAQYFTFSFLFGRWRISDPVTISATANR